uniref:Zgc:101664 n=1 Tax=Gadus morhua TaxID=8049 RepID=A0A8C4YYL9_GADMO
MEDVVLHYKPADAGQLSSLIWRTETALEPFLCRVLPTFTPWFPSTSDRLLPIRPSKPAPTRARPPPEKRTQKPVSGPHIRDGAVKRSWSVVAHHRLPLRSTPCLSKPFLKTVIRHGLHLQQRARWVLGQHNLGSAGDMEQLNRSIKRSSLPTCNANIQREQRQIWVFCDVLYSEHVGKHLKEELALSGQITLSVPKLGNILTL